MPNLGSRHRGERGSSLRSSGSKPGVGNYDGDDDSGCSCHHEKPRTTETSHKGKELYIGKYLNKRISLEIKKSGRLEFYVPRGGVKLSAKMVSALLRALQDFVEGRKFSNEDYGVRDA